MLKKIFSVLLCIGLVFLGFLGFANYKILKYRSYITSSSTASAPVALVFGAGMNKDGTMGQMLADRVKVGVELYKEGKVESIMMTGDDGERVSDEVDAMVAAAEAAGVPENKVAVDRHGYRTYESCYREAKVYGLTKVVAVSQTFHLPRIAYFCKNFGIETVGVPADLSDYGWRNYFMEVREMGARLKGYIQMEFTHPLPQTLQKN